MEKLVKELSKFHHETDFSKMDITNEGSVHTNNIYVYFEKGTYFIRVLKTKLNSNCDEIPYWNKMWITGKELDDLKEMISAFPKQVQLNLHRTNGGVLIIGIYAGV